MSDKLSVGFFRFDAYPNWGAAAAPAPRNFKIVTIGGPRKIEDVRLEISACEIKLEELRKELLWLEGQQSGKEPSRG